MFSLLMLWNIPQAFALYLGDQTIQESSKGAQRDANTPKKALEAVLKGSRRAEEEEKVVMMASQECTPNTEGTCGAEG